ncbi:polyketide cyclase / dehydrase and lipid transport domain-containing protein [Sarocladium implicatum]|nr:polyketide cyclase / dehydrase and lipid transport domain-containing protein [Sarocladium implicatum]
MSLRTASRLTTTASSLPGHYTRSFLTLPNSSTTQNLTALRKLPYAPSPLYDLIADVDSYSSFVPYCSRSRVTAWSNPDPSHDNRRWPTLADLHVGWGGFEEVFTSRLRCIPGESVEAVSGGEGERDASAVFKSLVTRWALRPLEGAAGGESKPMTEVHLSIKYQFVNPLYAAVSSAVSDKIAGLMIEAFEKRAREKLGQSHDAL